MNATELKTIEKLNKPTILPGSIKINVKIDVNEEETKLPEEEIIPQNEEIPQDAELDLANDNENEEEEESEFDFSGMNKLQLVELLEETVQEQDIAKIKDKVAAIKSNFLKLNKEDRDREMEQFILDGGDKESYEHKDDPLEVRFKAAFDIYKVNKEKYKEELEKQKNDNLQKKLGIIEELKALIYSEETLKKTYDDFRALQDRWKEIGQVPANEVSNIWNTYHFLIEKFYDKVKINRELRQ